MLLLQDGLDQYAAIKKEALTDTDVKLSTANLNEDDEPETTNNKESNKLDPRPFMLKHSCLYKAATPKGKA